MVKKQTFKHVNNKTMNKANKELTETWENISKKMYEVSKAGSLALEDFTKSFNKLQKKPKFIHKSKFHK